MNRFRSQTIDSKPWGESVGRILEAAIQSVEPGSAIAKHVSRRNNQLQIGKECDSIISIDLDCYRRILLVGVGKAGVPMTESIANILGDYLTEGVVIVKEGYAETKYSLIPPTVHILEAGHPIPDQRGVEATQRVADLLTDTTGDDLVICLISGGGSALLVLPAPGLSLPDLQGMTSSLLSCGADISQINTLRKHLEQLKGGGLAHLAYPAKLITLILSDVVGNPLDVIASGPTVPDPSTYQEAYQILQRYSLLDKISPSILSHIERGLNGEIQETPKEGNPTLAGVLNVVIGDNIQAVQTALQQAQEEEFNTLMLTTSLQGEARQAGRFLASVAHQVVSSGQPVPRPACIAAGGETTVTVTGNGMGGRNLELALSTVIDLADLPGIALVTLATDGGDGPTDAAGAIVTGETLQRARLLDLDPVDYLERNDSYHFFEQLGDLLKPGPTQTNVNDLTFLFAF